MVRPAYENTARIRLLASVLHSVFSLLNFIHKRTEK